MRLDEQALVRLPAGIQAGPVRTDPKTGSRAAFPESSEKEFLVSSVRRGEDLVAPVAASHDVVKGSLVFNADLARHKEKMASAKSLSNSGFVP